jgi:hypothetical protein
VQDADREPERSAQGQVEEPERSAQGQVQAGGPERDEKSRRRNIPWRRLLISILVIVAGLSIPMLLLIENFRQSASAPVFPSEFITHHLSGSSVVVYAAPDSPVVFCLTLSFLSLSSGETSSDQLRVGLTVTEQGLAMLERIYSPQATGTLTIQSFGEPNSSIPLPLSVLKELAVPSCSREQLDQFAPGQTDVITSSAVTGVPRAFPNDWYALGNVVYISFPPTPGTKNIRYWSGYTSVLMSSEDVDYSLSVFADDASNFSTEPNLGPILITAYIVRPRLFQSYIYLVAAAPFILLISIFAIYYSRNPRRRKPEPYELAFGITAALVAILPLRSVLIPSSLPSPTRLDLFFGVGAIFLVVSSIVWLIFSSATPDDNGSQPKNRGSVSSETAEQPGRIEGTAPHEENKRVRRG